MPFFVMETLFTKRGVTMSGPSLEREHSHRSIHNGAFREARSLTDLLRRLHGERRTEEVHEVADALIEHWEKRILAHAQAEEEGLFPKKVERNPELAPVVHMMKRDHDLMRQLLDEIKVKWKQSGVNYEVFARFEALLLINRIHSRQEERDLL